LNPSKLILPVPLGSAIFLALALSSSVRGFIPGKFKRNIKETYLKTQKKKKNDPLNI